MRALSLLCLLPLACSPITPTTTTAPPTTAAATAKQQAALLAKKDPYPECATCLQWLKENAGDPASLEVISWEDRSKERHGEALYKDRVFQGYDQQGPQADYVLITVKYRLRNVLGGMGVERRRFSFKDGQLERSYDLDGRPSPGAVLR